MLAQINEHILPASIDKSFSPDHPIRTAMPAAVACASPCSAVYRRRQPECTLLYRTVQTPLGTWLALQEEGAGANALAVIEREFRRTLEGGLFAHGFARACCADCGYDFLFLVACSGQCRGVCPSCTARRGLLSADDAQGMAEWKHGGGFPVDAEVRIEAQERESLARSAAAK